MFINVVMDTFQMFSYLGVFILDTFLGRNDKPPQHYHLANCT
jgi:hypothetical protein